MPLLNGRGDVLGGAGGAQGHLNGRPFPFVSFSGGAWLDDGTVLVAIPASTSSGSVLATWSVGAPSPTPIPDPANQGANDWAAGGGRWIAWLAGYGVFGALGHLPAAGLPNSGTPVCRHCVAPDGTIAYVPDRQAGNALMLANADGSPQGPIGPMWPYDAQTLGHGAVIWRGGAYGTPTPRPGVSDAITIVAVDLPDGERWLVYWSNSLGFVVQLDGASDGYLLGTTGTFFNHHARAVGNELVVAYSLTQGEAPGDVRVVVIDRTVARVPLVPPPVEPPTEPPVEPPVDVVPPEPEPEPPQPEPIPPQPQPEPEPEPEVRMLFIETKYEKTNPKLAVMKFDIIANPDGSESYRSVVRAASDDATIKGAPIYCVTPEGVDEWRENPGGAWESFRRTGNVVVADRDWEDEQNAYVRFCVEVK